MVWFGVVGGVDADSVDRRDQNTLDALGDEVLNAVDLFELVFVRGNGSDIEAELAGAGANALEHADVERVVVLRQRDADCYLVLGARDRRER
jgi:hypothetical protein